MSTEVNSAHIEGAKVSAPKIMVVGGVAMSLVNFRGPLLERMVRAGYEVVAAAPSATEEDRAQLEAIGVSYIDIPISRAGLNPFGDLGTIFAVAKAVRAAGPSRILAYTAKPIVYTAIGSRLVGGPRIHALVTGLGYAFGDTGRKQRLVGKMAQGLYRIASRWASAFIFQNPDDVEEFRRHGIVDRDTPTHVVNGSGVDLSKFQQQPLPSGPVSFLLIARLLQDKGIREYVAAAREVKKEFPSATFALAGGLDANPNSVGAEELDAWVAEGVVQYLGKLGDVRPAYGRCAVYVLPSYREGTPRTVLEAMAIGRPVITTDAPGCRETVVEGLNGFLVPPRDTSSLVEAMKRLLQRPSLIEEMAVESRRLAEDKYDAELVAAQTMSAMGLEGN